jgi:hypothetical protein
MSVLSVNRPLSQSPHALAPRARDELRRAVATFSCRSITEAYHVYLSFGRLQLVSAYRKHRRRLAALPYVRTSGKPVRPLRRPSEDPTTSRPPEKGHFVRTIDRRWAESPAAATVRTAPAASAAAATAAALFRWRSRPFQRQRSCTSAAVTRGRHMGGDDCWRLRDACTAAATSRGVAITTDKHHRRRSLTIGCHVTGRTIHLRSLAVL